MPNIVELQYDPFIPRLSVLINGNHPSDYSRLIQYADEEIWYWCEEILDIIYEELRDDFVVVFTGRPEDIEIIKCVAKYNCHCVGFKSKDFTITDSMQVRLGKLNQLIKRERITSYQKTIIDAGFLFAPSMKDYLEDILELDINNLFCSVRVSTIGVKTYTQDSSESYVFIIANSYEEAKTFINKVKSSNPIFLVFFGGNTEIAEIYKHHVLC